VVLQITQMKFRLSEGSGECFYYLGVEDDGYPRGLDTQALQESMAVIHRMAVSLQVSLTAHAPAAPGQQTPGSRSKAIGSLISQPGSPSQC
jgi:GTPase